MINGVIIKKYNIHKYKDNRGWICEIYRNDESDFRPAMGYVSVTKPGIIRGPHEHKFQSDAFIFLGPGNYEMHLWDNRENSSTKGQSEKILVGEDNPVMVIIPPGVIHGYKCVGDTEAWYLNLPDKLYKGEGKKEEADEIRWEKDPASPYKIE